MRQDHSPGVDHIDAVLKGDPDDIILGEVCTDWSKAFAYLISLVGLAWKDVSTDGKAETKGSNRTF